MITEIIVFRPGERAAEMRKVELPERDDSGLFHDRLFEVIRGYAGAPFERVNVFADWLDDGIFRYRDMFVNQNGHVVGMGRNAPATAIYRNNVLMHEPGKYPTPEALPWIAGPAVLFRDKVWS